jgi:malate dehydrogenase (oxaloacetate-decarboxylating)
MADTPRRKTSAKATSSARRKPTASAQGLNYRITVRVRIAKNVSTIAAVRDCISKAGGFTGAIDNGRASKDHSERDVTINVRDEKHSQTLLAKLARVKGVEVMASSNSVFLKHLRGKIGVTPKLNITTREELSEVYTPGVAQVCTAIHQNPDKAWSLTVKGNMVAVISDGSRVLSLGDIGPEAALPVMEGKAMLFKRFGDVDAFPITLATQDTDEIVRTIQIIAPVFGAINLEDIASPRCYDIERRLRETLDIPVFHDDQHATAVVVVAAAINAAKLVGKPLSSLKLVAAGTGAAGLACIKLLHAAGIKNIIAFNSKGAVHAGTTNLSEPEQWLVQHTNQSGFKGPLKKALVGADMFLGLAASNLLKGKDLKPMNKDAIVFALANPIPEVLPEDAAPYVRVIGTGGSNYPNQINNALVFPGMFRGALRARVPQITEDMKMAAAQALAAVVTDDELHEDLIIPSVLDPRVAKAIAQAVVKIAVEQGLARRVPTPDEI